MCFSANVTLTSMFVGTSFQRNSFLLTRTRLAKACTKTKYQLAPNWGIKPNTLSFLSSPATSYKLCKGQRFGPAFLTMDYDAGILLDSHVRESLLLLGMGPDPFWAPDPTIPDRPELG